jgi:UDP-GlcNAc3NAcA epimerase
MSDVFFRDLGLPEPDYNLGVSGGGHGQMTGRMIESLEPVMEREAPDLVVVYGDTNTTLAGALVAAKLDLPVAHVEAGLRSFNRAMPEEINRVVADHLSQLLFCPTRAAVESLRREGIVRNVHNVGDVMYDATLHARETALCESGILSRLDLEEGGYAVATLHRQENTDNRERLVELVAYLKRESGTRPIVLPLHPRTRNALAQAEASLDGLVITPPLGYLDMHRLLQSATTVYTDSGGLQKEAYFHRVPCVTLRSETEWVETVENGWNRLWRGPTFRERHEITEYGDGNAARRIAEIICNHLLEKRS